MADEREKISTGPNERAVNETIAGTGPGVPDDALAPGEELPDAPTDEQVERAKRALGVGAAESSDSDDLPVEGQ